MSYHSVQRDNCILSPKDWYSWISKYFSTPRVIRGESLVKFEEYTPGRELLGNTLERTSRGEHFGENVLVTSGECFRKTILDNFWVNILRVISKILFGNKNLYQLVFKLFMLSENVIPSKECFFLEWKYLFIQKILGSKYYWRLYVRLG